MKTLAIDIGGSNLKASVLIEDGTPMVDRVRVATPVGAPPETLVDALAELVAHLPPYDRVSVGFPGVVRHGTVLVAPPNLENAEWAGFKLAPALADKLGKPVKVINDAEMQGLAVIKGHGVEMVVTLGTGFGSSLFVDGRRGAHLELAHHPFRKGETYDEQLGSAARKQIGTKKWNKRVERAIKTVRMLTNFDHLYIGGGNSKKVTLELPPDVSIVSNEAGIMGGLAVWRDG
ncbi:MAG: ROK family protein [Candidatus Rokuibacteriota bacterium]